MSGSAKQTIVGLANIAFCVCLIALAAYVRGADPKSDPKDGKQTTSSASRTAGITVRATYKCSVNHAIGLKLGKKMLCREKPIE